MTKSEDYLQRTLEDIKAFEERELLDIILDDAIYSRRVHQINQNQFDTIEKAVKERHDEIALATDMHFHFQNKTI